MLRYGLVFNCKNISFRIKKILVEASFFSLKAGIFLKKIILAFLAIFFIPVKFFLKWIFNIFFVRFYCLYLNFLKKIGWTKIKHDIYLAVFNRRVVHFLAVFLVLCLSFLNLAKSGKASVSEVAKNALIADIVQSEFGLLDDDEDLIEEFYDENLVLKFSSPEELEEYLALKAEPRFAKPDEEGLDFLIEETGSALKTETGVKAGLSQTRTEVVYYTVQSGDTISTIAEEFGVSVNTILWENNLNSHGLIRPGDKLAILPSSGLRHTVASGDTLLALASKYDITVEEIKETNGLGDNDILSIGQKLILPGASKQTYSAPKTTSSYSGFSAIKDLITPSKSTATSSNKMAWPTEGHRITQYYSWRHTGLDIANKLGTPIYAADSGTVTYSGWSTGYGYRIDIDHGGGKKTRYAHHTKLYVSVGQKVSKGETIGLMGSTGWSTGPHLHFEVIINGTKYNPLNYIK